MALSWKDLLMLGPSSFTPLAAVGVAQNAPPLFVWVLASVSALLWVVCAAFKVQESVRAQMWARGSAVAALGNFSARRRVDFRFAALVITGAVSVRNESGDSVYIQAIRVRVTNKSLNRNGDGWKDEWVAVERRLRPQEETAEVAVSIVAPPEWEEAGHGLYVQVVGVRVRRCGSCYESRSASVIILQTE